MSDKHDSQPRENIGEDLNNAQILMVGISYALVVLISMVLLAALHQKKMRQEMESKGVREGISNLEEARASQAARLGSYDWVDYEDGVVSLTIERAMELAAARLSKGEDIGMALLETNEYSGGPADEDPDKADMTNEPANDGDEDD